MTRHGRLVCFVEVKARATHDLAREALRPTGRRRIERAALAWQSARLGRLDQAVRFDLVTVAGRWPRHWPGAWRAGE